MQMLFENISEQVKEACVQISGSVGNYKKICLIKL